MFDLRRIQCSTYAGFGVRDGPDFTVLLSHFTTLAATDAPQNASNNINCGSCHGDTLLNSPFWDFGGTYDQLCLNCHKASSGRIVKTVMDTIMGRTEGAIMG